MKIEILLISDCDGSSGHGFNILEYVLNYCSISIQTRKYFCSLLDWKRLPWIQQHTDKQTKFLFVIELLPFFLCVFLDVVLH